MMFTTLLFTAFFFLGLFALSQLISALRRLHKRDSKKVFKQMGTLFFYRPLFLWIFPKDDYEGILFSAIVAQNLTRFLVVIAWAFWIYSNGFMDLPVGLIVLYLLLMGVFFYAVGDYLPRLLGSRYPQKSARVAGMIASPYLMLSFPVSLIFIKISQGLFKSSYFDYLNEPMAEVKHEVFEILQEANISPQLTPHDRQLIESVVRFQNRIAREVMVPRIDMFSLESSVTIEEAAKKLEEEGYSRVPVYKDSIDKVIGVLMYKDIMTKYMEYRSHGNDPKILAQPIETIIKSVMYTPETKKISNLLQDFKKKQVHLSIVVDEYGGTEGIVTIEDILEEIVGDIEDEYDDEKDLYTKISDGSWIVDARMGINDAETELGIEIPQEGDYDTIGGYIFDQAGTIPARGFTIKLNDIELEVLKSNERRIEKVKIKKNEPPLENESKLE